MANQHAEDGQKQYASFKIFAMAPVIHCVAGLACFESPCNVAQTHWLYPLLRRNTVNVCRVEDAELSFT